MEKSKRRLIRQLQKLEEQIDALKNNYLSRLGSLPLPNLSEKKAIPSSADTREEPSPEKVQKLLEQALSTGKENKIYKAVKQKINSLLKSGKESFSAADLMDIRETLEKAKGKTDHWEIFRKQFSAVYPEFFENLLKAHPDLTKTEVKFCTYLRLHLTSQQIASAMDISMEAIRKNRYRIRKKLSLNTEDSLEAYIDRF